MSPFDNAGRVCFSTIPNTWKTLLVGSGAAVRLIPVSVTETQLQRHGCAPKMLSKGVGLRSLNRLTEVWNSYNDEEIVPSRGKPGKGTFSPA